MIRTLFCFKRLQALGTVFLAVALAGLGLHSGEPVEPVSFKHAGIIDAWEAYAGKLTFGKGQTLALVDDGCKLSMPEWSTSNGDRPKVLVSYDSVDGDDDPKHEGKGYHGSTIGVPSSLNFQGKWGVAYNDQVAVVRALECCHCKMQDHKTLAAGLAWVIDHHKKYHITTVNLAPVDDEEHDQPVETEIDARLKTLRELGIWVSAPAGNHNFTKGISWPACQPNCFAVGAVTPGKDMVYLDRHPKVDLVVPAAATSSSNAIACGAAIILREAIEKTEYDWKKRGRNLPEALLAIMQETGQPVEDPATKQTFRRLDLRAALDHVFANAAEPKQDVPQDPDFLVQGEYQGEVAKAGARGKVGVQVIALGNGKFRAVVFRAGLPGEGWDKSDTLEWEGETANGATTFNKGDDLARIENGSMEITAGSIGSGKLKRVSRQSPTLGAKPPRGAVVVFDGKSADQFAGGRMTETGLLMQGATTKAKFQSGTLHVEFQVPFGPQIPSRGNSGVYLQSRYEVQILDSIGYKPHNHECGGIPSVRAPDLTMSYPPLAWQTYDVEFTAAQYQNGKKEKNARMTVRHNGVLIHDDAEVPHITTSAPLEEGPEPGPINLQDHSSEVRYRNIWFHPKGD